MEGSCIDVIVRWGGGVASMFCVFYLRINLRNVKINLSKNQDSQTQKCRNSKELTTDRTPSYIQKNTNNELDKSLNENN